MIHNILPGITGQLQVVGGVTPPASGASVWLESDFGLTYNGSNQVNLWADQSGNSNDANQPTGSYKPLYIASDANMNGLDSIYFNAGSDDYMRVLYNAATMNAATNGFTCYIVAYPTSWFSSFAFLLGHTNGTSWTQGWFIYNYSSQIHFTINNWNSSTAKISLATPSTNQLTLFKFKWDKSTMDAFYRQGGVTTSGTKAFGGSMSVPTGTSYWEMFRGGSSSYDTSGKLGAILFYPTPLNAADELATENYLKTKYGIS